MENGSKILTMFEEIIVAAEMGDTQKLLSIDQRLTGDLTMFEQSLYHGAVLSIKQGGVVGLRQYFDEYVCDAVAFQTMPFTKFFLFDYNPTHSFLEDTNGPKD